MNTPAFANCLSKELEGMIERTLIQARGLPRTSEQRRTLNTVRACLDAALIANRMLMHPGDVEQ